MTIQNKRAFDKVYSNIWHVTYQLDINLCCVFTFLTACCTISEVILRNQPGVFFYLGRN